jgi:hypothetical protein
MASVKDQLAKIDSYLAIAKAEEEKLSKGCKAAAAKLRNALLEVGKECSELRKNVLDIGKAIPVKHRAPKDQQAPSSGSEADEGDVKEAEVKMPDLPPLPSELKRQDGMSIADLMAAPPAQPVAPPAQPAAPLAPAKKPRAPRKKPVAEPVAQAAAPPPINLVQA